jgi:hypothetical protein
LKVKFNGLCLEYLGVEIVYGEVDDKSVGISRLNEASDFIKINFG